MENEEKPIKSTVLNKCDNLDSRSESQMQVPNLADYIDIQDESENEMNNLLAEGNGAVHDLHDDFHDVINSILELLNAFLEDTIQIMEDDVDGLLDHPNDEDCSAMLSDKENVSDDSGQYCGINDACDIFTN